MDERCYDIMSLFLLNAFTVSENSGFLLEYQKAYGLYGLTVGMYRIAIVKIRLEPDVTGYQMNYPAGTGCLNTCCIAPCPDSRIA